MSGNYVMAMDAGTTGIRAILFDRAGGMVAEASQEFPQIYPVPGWVEHNPLDIWNTQITVAKKVLDTARGLGARTVAAIGITNQRETTIVWDRQTGHPVMNAIVWQDRRTAGLCDELKDRGLTDIRPPDNGSGHRRLLLRDQAQLDPRARAGRSGACRTRRVGIRHRRQLADLEPHRRLQCTSPTTRTPPARCSSTSTGCTGTSGC